MSHEIMKTADGTFAMAYREGDALPWHAGETNPQGGLLRLATQRRKKLATPHVWVMRSSLSRIAFPDGSDIPESFHISRVDNSKPWGAPSDVFGRFVAGDWQAGTKFGFARLGGAYIGTSWVRDYNGWRVVRRRKGVCSIRNRQRVFATRKR